MNKKGFTLIELLAVIIILGILMIIAIPSVTKYINDSRKNAYVDTANEVIGAARNLVNSGKLEMYDTDATYYLDVKCIETENAMKSPYGEFVDLGAFVVVTYNGKGYDYYWTSVDDAGQGIKEIVKSDKLDIDNIESDLSIDDIKTNRIIDGRNKVILIKNRNGCKKEGAITENLEQASSGGEGQGVTIPPNIVCIPATTLHTATCERTDDYGCNATGQAGYGNTITYGTLVNGSPKAGDAYNCDVDNDGTYDPETERFYYVKSDGDTSILIYYTNMHNLLMFYDTTSTNQNWHGPRKVSSYLPSEYEWSNPGLILQTERNIVAQNGSEYTDNGYRKIDPFAYYKPARLLTYEEVTSICGSSGVQYTGYLNNYTWLLENIGQYEGYSGSEGYWLETPQYYSSSLAWNVYGISSSLSCTISNTAVYGARPVVTILTSDLGQ
jgi:prepilin-type N-terminal cleavage/methylation domain-containing protein